MLKNCAQHGIITHRKPSRSAAIPVSCTVQNLDKNALLLTSKLILSCRIVSLSTMCVANLAVHFGFYCAMNFLLSLTGY